MIDRIDFTDERFRIAYIFELAPLIRSISEIGLVHPPVLTYREEKAIIVTGWKRLLACRSLGMASVICSIFEGPSDLDAFRLALEENLTSRLFTLLEKAQILTRLIQVGIPESEVVKGYLTLLDIPRTPNHLDTFLHIAALDAETKEFIHSKNTIYPVAELLTEYSEEQRRLLLPFLHPLGQNKQKELLRNLLEISKRDRNPIENILKDAQIQKVSQDPNLSPLQKADAVRTLVYRRRYPTVSAWTDSFRSSKKDLEWPDGIQIEPSPFFEGEEVEVRFAFKNIDEFKGKLNKINELSSNETIAKLLQASPKK